jgi:hypothetical protein
MKKKLSSILLVLCCTLLLCNCEEENISSNVRSVARFNFINSITQKQTAMSASLTVTAYDTDSILIKEASNATNATLPFKYSGNITTFIYKFSDTVKDTIWIEHDNYPHYISMDAGISMYYNIKSAKCTTYLLDSIVTTNTTVNEEEKENFLLYFTPIATNE